MIYNVNPYIYVSTLYNQILAWDRRLYLYYECMFEDLLSKHTVINYAELIPSTLMLALLCTYIPSFVHYFHRVLPSEGQSVSQNMAFWASLVYWCHAISYQYFICLPTLVPYDMRSVSSCVCTLHVTSTLHSKTHTLYTIYINQTLITHNRHS